MLDIHLAYQQTLEFVCSEATSFLAWAELETAVSYWAERHQPNPQKICNDIFPLLTSAAVGGTVEKALPLAAFWLLNIIAARVLDDVQDQEGSRHPWNADGLAQALPTGIALLTTADICLAQLRVDSQTWRDLFDTLKRATALAAKAQRYPLTKTTTLSSYLENSIAQTGQIMAVGAWAGGRLQTSDHAILQALWHYGQNIGLKMAILSDCLDLSPQDPGKLSDLTVAVYKLPVIYAVSLTEHRCHSRLRYLLQDPKPLFGARLADVIGLLEEMGAIAWCTNLAIHFQQQATAALVGLPNEIQQQLQAYV